MAFGHPLAFFWALLAIPIVLLYRRRIRLRRQPVATSMIWQQVFAAEQLRDAWQRWRHPVSLAVQLTVLALIVVALADPQIPGPRRVVLIVDNSANSNAAGVEPLPADHARQLIGGLRPCDQMSVIAAAGSMPSVRCNLTSDQDRLREACDSIPPPAGSMQLEMAVDLAVDLARRVLQPTAGGQVVLLSNGRIGPATGSDDLDEIRSIQAGSPGPAPWLALGGFGVMLLALEWCLYQRRWIC